MVSKQQRRFTLRRKLHILRTLAKSKAKVKVEKLGGGFLVRVSCKKGEDLLVSIIEAFEEKNLNVVEARVTCKDFFSMEAIVEAEDHQQAVIVNEREITEAVLKAIDKENKVIGDMQKKHML